MSLIKTKNYTEVIQPIIKLTKIPPIPRVIKHRTNKPYHRVLINAEIFLPLLNEDILEPHLPLHGSDDLAKIQFTQEKLPMTTMTSIKWPIP